jgi:type IV secretory pathway TrbF-like protein
MIRVAVAFKGTPMYEDQLVAWQNQTLFKLVVGLGALLAVAVADIIYKDSHPAPPPYVIEVDSKGEPIGAVQPVLGTQAIGVQTIRWAISEYIDHAFRIDVDWYEETSLLSKVYQMSTGQAGKALTAWYHSAKGKNDPTQLGSKCWQEVKILRTLKQPAPDTYRVEYQTIRHSMHDENNPTVTNWAATMRVIMGKPTEINPLGLWVDDLDFAPEAQ